MTKFKILLTAVLLAFSSASVGTYNTDQIEVSAATYGETSNSIYVYPDQGYGTGTMLWWKLPESIDPEDTTVDITFFSKADLGVYFYNIKINGTQYSINMNADGTSEKTITYDLDSGDIDSGNPDRYKLYFTEMMYGTIGNFSTSTGTSYLNLANPVDETPPLINGATAVHIINYDTPTTVSTLEATLTATDNVDGDITANITVSRDLYTGNEASLGDREVDFSVSDSSGNSTTVTVIFRTVDVTNPIITLLGSSTIRVEYGDSFSDPGYTVSDNHDSSVTVNVTGSVNDSVLGNYVLDYNATDSSGNTATERTRTVIVEDTTAPVQTLQGDSTIYVEFGDNFTDPGATWIDGYDGSGNSVVTGSVNVGVLGTYTLRYNITDTEGNAASEVTRTVVVRDTTSPTFSGDTSYLFNTGTSLTLTEILTGITVSDLYDGDLTANIVVTSDNYTGNEELKGIYQVILTVTDSQGNSETMTIDIEVIDNEPPVFSTSENLYSLEYANTLSQEQLKQILGVS